jgi:hypothetical protein
MINPPVSLNRAPLLALQEGGGEAPRAYFPEVADEVLGKEGDESGLICRVCGSIITSEARKVLFGGRQTHTFFNPQGLVFELGCFASAPGCDCRGPRTDEFSWFKGYSWEFALCGACGEHLGWHYIAGGHDFFGLILNKLRSRY